MRAARSRRASRRSFSTALLCRERALIVNIEHCHAIVTDAEALVPVSAAAADPAAAAFVAELARRLAAHAGGDGGGISVATGAQAVRLRACRARASCIGR